jgi:hypothetical protein
MCRLFGFAAAAGSGSRPELAVCGVMRAAIPDQTRAAAEAVRWGGLKAPVMREWSLAAYRLDPTLGSQPLPINAALKQALERVGLERSYAAAGSHTAIGGYSRRSREPEG